MDNEKKVTKFCPFVSVPYYEKGFPNSFADVHKNTCYKAECVFWDEGEEKCGLMPPKTMNA